MSQTIMTRIYRFGEGKASRLVVGFWLSRLPVMLSASYIDAWNGCEVERGEQELGLEIFHMRVTIHTYKGAAAGESTRQGCTLH